MIEDVPFMSLAASLDKSILPFSNALHAMVYIVIFYTKSVSEFVVLIGTLVALKRLREMDLYVRSLEKFFPTGVRHIHSVLRLE